MLSISDLKIVLTVALIVLISRLMREKTDVISVFIVVGQTHTQTPKSAMTT